MKEFGFIKVNGRDNDKKGNNITCVKRNLDSSGLLDHLWQYNEEMYAQTLKEKKEKTSSQDVRSTNQLAWQAGPHYVLLRFGRYARLQLPITPFST